MAKNFINSAITGNGRMLACYNQRGTLERLLWPSIDRVQQLDYFRIGITFYEMGWDTVWLDDEAFVLEQKYIESSNIFESFYSNENLGLIVNITEFVVHNSDVLVRSIKIKNAGPFNTKLGVVVHFKSNTNNKNSSGIYYNYADNIINSCDADNYLSITADVLISDISIGDNLSESIQKLIFNTSNSYNLSQEAAILYKIGEFNTLEEKSLNFFIGINKNLDDSENILLKIRDQKIEELKKSNIEYYKKYFCCLSNKKLDERIYIIVQRSILSFILLQNKETGAILAAPEVDEERIKCGGYGYCWCRDAVFITEAMEELGLYKEAEKFYTWTSKVQTKEGFFYQRYYTDGNYAPSWGIQIDETGSVLYGIWKHYMKTRNRLFLENMWETVRKGALFLCEFIDHENGLPKLSYDIWEERYGQHAYSSAAVYSGIMAAYKVATELRKDISIANFWREAAQTIKKSIEQEFYHEGKERFIRSIRVKKNPWGEEPTNDTVIINQELNRSIAVSRYDFIRDISILGLNVPFRVFENSDERLIRTIVDTEKSLHKEGGLLRYEEDNYIGGNPWVISTLWMALFYIEAGNRERAMDLFYITIRASTELGFLPEQYDTNTFDSLWVLPLTWSHAMFILVIVRLLKLGWI